MKKNKKQSDYVIDGLLEHTLKTMYLPKNYMELFCNAIKKGKQNNISVATSILNITTKK